MDARIVVNSPPLTDGTSVRGPHLDIPNKLISALLNLRPEHDDSIGGELDLYEPAGGSLRFVDGNAAAPGTVRRVLSYPYRHNLMILPLVRPSLADYYIQPEPPYYPGARGKMGRNLARGPPRRDAVRIRDCSRLTGGCRQRGPAPRVWRA